MTAGLAIIATPRSNGNSEIAAKIILDAAGFEHKSIINLYDLNLKPCTACYSCLFQEGCVIDDDVTWILKKIDETDSVILISNTYFMGINGVWKLFLDRMLLLNQYKNIKDTPAVLLAVSGIKGWEGLTLSSLASAAFSMELDVKAKADLIATLPGDIESSKERIINLGKILSGETENECNYDEFCNFCGSNCFKLSCGTAICAICGKPHKSGKPLIAAAASWTEHGDWLRKKKNEFLARRKELLTIHNRYNKLKYGIKPDKED